MKNAWLLSLLLLLIVVVDGCQRGNGRGLETPRAYSGHRAHWSYEGETRPDMWGDLDPGFATCKTGKSQTPINITGAKPADLAPLRFLYEDVALKIIDNGHTIQVNYPPGSKVSIREKTYELLQFHFHAKSENTVEGKYFDMEMHLVHRDPSGALAVVAVFLEKGGAPHAELEKVWANLPTAKNQETVVENVEINAKHLLPTNRVYYHFAGSLTTPPCTEGVDWNVLKAPIKISDDQLARFRSIYAGNYRPIQPLMGRAVVVSR